MQNAEIPKKKKTPPEGHMKEILYIYTHKHKRLAAAAVVTFSFAPAAVFPNEKKWITRQAKALQ